MAAAPTVTFPSTQGIELGSVHLVVFLILAIVWAVVLIPHHLVRRAHNRPGDSVVAFQRQLSVLGRRGNPVGRVQPIDAPVREEIEGDALRERRLARARVQDSTHRRRQAVLFGLFAGISASLVLGFAPGLGALHVLHLLLDVLLVAYVALLLRLRSSADAGEGQLRYLPTTPARVPEPSLLLRRSGS